VWGLVFSSFDCSLGYVRQRDDPWNAIGSGFLTGGVLAARAGLRASVQSAMVGGVLLALIEGLALTINKFTAEQYRPVRPELPAVATAPPSSTSLPPMKLPSLGGSAGGGAPLRKKESEFLPGACTLPSASPVAALLYVNPCRRCCIFGVCPAFAQMILTSRNCN